MTAPCDKQRFTTGAQARNAIAGIRARGTKHDKKPARAYRCPHCGGWHLTSQPQ